jgi:hypothetical protein
MRDFPTGATLNASHASASPRMTELLKPALFNVGVSEVLQFEVGREPVHPPPCTLVCAVFELHAGGMMGV